MIFAEIAVALPVDGLYTYRIPKDMRIQVGHAVLIPFGNRKISGYVIKLANVFPVCWLSAGISSNAQKNRELIRGISNYILVL